MEENVLHQSKEETQERGGYRIQETEDQQKKKTKGIAKMLMKKPQTKLHSRSIGLAKKFLWFLSKNKRRIFHFHQEIFE